MNMMNGTSDENDTSNKNNDYNDSTSMSTSANISNSDNNNSTINTNDDDDTFVVNARQHPAPSTSDSTDRQQHQQVASASVSTSTSLSSPSDEFQDNPTSTTNTNTTGNHVTTNTTATATIGNATIAQAPATNTSMSKSTITHSKKVPMNQSTSISSASASASLLDSAIEEEEEQQQRQRRRQQQQQQQQQQAKKESTTTNDASTGTSSNDANDANDNETKVATQMAAVAALVTAATREHKIENSPSVAATYAKGLMTSTISSGSGNDGTNNSTGASNGSGSNGQMQNPPPSSSPPPLNTGTTVIGMKKKKKTKTVIIPVHLNLVQKYLNTEIESLLNVSSTSAENEITDDHDSAVTNSTDENEKNSNHETKEKDVDTDVDINTDTATGVKDNQKENEDEISTSNNNNKNTPKDGQNIINNLENNDNDTNSTSSSKTSTTTTMILLRQMQNGENINFLKQLLILTHHTCIDIGQQSQQETEKNNNNNGEEKKDKENYYDSQKLASPSSSSLSPQKKQQSLVNEERAKRAASKVVELLQEIDSTFGFLHRLLPSVNNTQSKSKNKKGENTKAGLASASTSTTQKDDNDNENVGLEDYDPSKTTTTNAATAEESTMTTSADTDTLEDVLLSNSTIPDLLPLCLSSRGDATNIFFKACAPVQPPLSSSSLNINKNDVISSSKASSSSSTTVGKTTSRNATSVFAGVIQSVKTGGIGKGRRNRNKAKVTATEDNDDRSTTSTATTASIATNASRNLNDNHASSRIDANAELPSQIGLDYHVVIKHEMLGLTVENVLERTVVRTIIRNGAAERAGTKIGSLIVKVGSVETAHLTHFETIDELRQSKRPLKLILREISEYDLKGAREEMGRLIKGGDFGNSTVYAGNSVRADPDTNSNDNHNGREMNNTKRYTLYHDTFTRLLRERWEEGAKLNSSSNSFNKKEEALSKAGAKLVWLLCLLIVGMEREAELIRSRAKRKREDNDESAVSNDFYSAEDYIDAAKSVSKVVHDYVQNHFARGTKTAASEANAQTMNKKRLKQAPPNHIQDRQRNAVPGASRRNPQQNFANVSSTSPTETALLKIGDVLHRTRSFFADPNSPPAALLRGEVIAMLCDVLDLDTEMALSEEEAASSTAGRGGGGGGGPINDLGSAGSLLKLIVLNCSVMKGADGVETDECYHALHAGNRFLAVVHRLAASRSTSARVTACSLGPVLWAHLDFPHQLQLRGVITRALHDSDVIVRKSTATVLHEIAELVFDSRAVPWLVLMCQRAMTDPDPQLRSAAMYLTWHLAEHLPNAFFGDAREGSRSRRRLPSRTHPAFAEVYLLQCKLFPLSTRLAEDGQASVRLSVAAQCDRLANALGGHWFVVIIDLLQALLGDKDDMVRAEATLCIPRLVEIVLVDDTPNVTILDSLLPVAYKLLKDPGTDVRIALATAAGELVTLLVGLQRCDEISIFEGSISKEQENSSHYKKYIDDMLIPLLQNLLQDPNPEVTSSALRAITNTSRGNVREISNRRNEDDSISLSSSHQSHIIEKKDPVFIPVLSEEQVLRLVPTLSKLATSGQWRVRQSAVEIVPALLGCTHKLETRSEIAQLCVTLMSDDVDAVRRTAAECLCLGANTVIDGDINSQEWVKTVVMPHVEACRQSPKSKQRLLSLKMVEVIITNGLYHSRGKIVGNIVNSSNNTPQNHLLRQNLEVLRSLSGDNTANVRLNVGRVSCSIIGTLEEEDLHFVISILEDQTNKEKTRPSGGDRDVHFFAKRAKKLAQERLNVVN